MQRWEVVRAGHSADHTLARDSLTHADPALRASALDALARLHTLTTQQLAHALGDPDASVRTRAAWCAARNPLGATPQIAALLRALLHDDDSRVCEMAAFALGETQSHSAIADLCHVASDHNDALCRESAIAALGCIGDRAGLPTVLGGLDDVATVRRRAVIALAAFDGPEVDAALARARADRDSQVRQSAEDLSHPAPADDDAEAEAEAEAEADDEAEAEAATPDGAATKR